MAWECLHEEIAEEFGATTREDEKADALEGRRARICARRKRAIDDWRRRGRCRGRCWYCAAPAEPGKTCCKEHGDYQKRNQKRMDDERRQNGLCVVCGKSATPGPRYGRPGDPPFRSCAMCRAKERVRMRRRSRANRKAAA